MKISQVKTVQVEAKTLSLHIKVCDTFECQVLDQHGEVIGYYEGYVPDFFPGKHYGDYLILDIDIGTGQITNWKLPRASDIEKLLQAST